LISRANNISRRALFLSFWLVKASKSTRLTEWRPKFSKPG